jgi:hypothetical protein
MEAEEELQNIWMKKPKKVIVKAIVASSPSEEKFISR